jgi:REP element-mobilizing transposase RayT
LPGDARGFRTRHHRQHVEGDYKNPPPPGRYKKLEKHSKKSLKHPTVILSPELLPVVGQALRDRLHESKVLMACLSVGDQHIHLLIKTPVGQARTLVGRAKQHTWFVLREKGWTNKLWGKRAKLITIRDRTHQINVYNYIIEHQNEGAWVWKYSDGNDISN